MPEKNTQMQQTTDPADALVPAQLNTIIHMGAGRCSELDAYLALNPENVLLVEADPRLIEALKARTENLPQVRVLQAAIAVQKGKHTFFRFNLPEAGSLHAPSGLISLFPGLRVVEQIDVETVPPVDVFDAIQLDGARENLLAIDLPGEEYAVLQALHEADKLHWFQHLHLYCGRDSLYEHAQPAAQILLWLKGHGFDLVTEDIGDDPDRPRWVLQRNVLAVEDRALKAQLEHVARVRDEQAELAARYLTEIEQLKESRTKVAEEAESSRKQLEVTTSELCKIRMTLDQQTRLVAEHVAYIAQLEKIKAEADKIATERQQQLEKAQTRVQQLESELNETAARQRLFQEEMVKAEGQIELIKDLLLREPGL